MEPRELTKEHREKLLEMCKELFPEYDFKLDKWQQPFVSLGLKTKKLYESHIHWFEFCMTYLAKKLLIMYDFTVYQTTGNFMYKHPVDYLYQNFKKLKNGK
jgi:hypothetical protein